MVRYVTKKWRRTNPKFKIVLDDYYIMENINRKCKTSECNDDAWIDHEYCEKCIYIVYNYINNIKSYTKYIDTATKTLEKKYNLDFKKYDLPF